MKHYFPLFLTLVVLGLQLNAQDPYTKLKRAAERNPEIKKELGEITISETDPRLRIKKKTPIPFTPFEMEDSAGRKINPNETVVINGETITAKDFFRKLNEIEKNLNDNGYSLRNNQPKLVIDMAIPEPNLDNKVREFSRSAGPLKSEQQIQAFTATTMRSGNLLLKPFGEYTDAEKKEISQTEYSVNGSEN